MRILFLKSRQYFVLKCPELEWGGGVVGKYFFRVKNFFDVHNSPTKSNFDFEKRIPKNYFPPLLPLFSPPPPLFMGKIFP